MKIFKLFFLLNFEVNEVRKLFIRLRNVKMKEKHFRVVQCNQLGNIQHKKESNSCY